MTPVPIQPRRVVDGEIGVGAVVGIDRHARRTRARLSNGFGLTTGMVEFRWQCKPVLLRPEETDQRTC
jgi:hypothetical protein